MKFAKWTDKIAFRNDILSAVIQTEKDKYHISFMLSKKMIQINLFTKQKQTHRHRKQIYGNQRGKGREGQIRNLGLIDTHYYI